MFSAPTSDAKLMWRRTPLDRQRPLDTDPYHADVMVHKREVKRVFGLGPTKFKVLTDNLVRLRIIQPSPLAIGALKVVQHDSNTFRLTALGLAFLSACTYDGQRPPDLPVDV